MSDVFIIGCGLSGAVRARTHAENGDKVYIFDKNFHIGGICYDYWDKDLLIQKYGPHIFHTSNEDVWKYVNRFSEWKIIDHKVKAHTTNGLVDLPFNLNTIKKLGLSKKDWEKEKNIYSNPITPKEFLINRVGTTIYKKLIEPYNQKQWGKYYDDIHHMIVRLPVRMNYNNSYFDDKYVALPINGYTKFIENILNHDNIKVLLNIPKKVCERFIYNFTDKKSYYCGKLDSIIGEYLPYRSIQFQYNNIDYGHSVINYPSKDIAYLRTTTMNRLTCESNKVFSVIETLTDHVDGYQGPHYPVITGDTVIKYELIKQKFKKIFPHVTPIGRTASYRILNMDECICMNIT